MTSGGVPPRLIEGPPARWRASAPRTTGMTRSALAARRFESLNDVVEVQEQLVGDNNLLPVSFLEVGLRVAAAVCQIVVPGRGVGSGFLVGPNVVLTNHHVVSTHEEAARARVRFNYQVDEFGVLEPSEYFDCRPDEVFHAHEPLDCALVAVDGVPGATYGVIPLAAPRPFFVGDRVNIIQHPMGQPKQIACVDNEIAYLDDTVVQYLTDTLPGSSGSPVFDDDWSLIAIHHSGGWIPEASGSSTHFRNEGIRLSAIVDHLVSVGLAH